MVEDEKGYGIIFVWVLDKMTTIHNISSIFFLLPFLLFVLRSQKIGADWKKGFVCTVILLIYR